MGTPKSLDQALAIIMATCPIADLNEFPYAVVKDFLSQRFGAYMLKYADNDILVKVLQELFNDVTARPHKEAKS